MAWCSLLPVGPAQGLGCTARQQQRGPEYQELAGEREAHWLCSAIRGESQKSVDKENMYRDIEISFLNQIVALLRGH